MKRPLKSTVNEVLCADCGRPIPTIPLWLCNAKVKFQCEECRQRHPRPEFPDMETKRATNEAAMDDLNTIGEVAEELRSEEETEAEGEVEAEGETEPIEENDAEDEVE
ncbi:MAG: hypothetical protein M1330_01920 [Armatimonadetes bacterium]|nr:hypothetical protein [Armatimonadota bacterium]